MSQNPPSPVHFFETINAFQQTEGLKAAIELGIFTAIDEGNQTAEQIGKRCETSRRGMRILCDFLTIMKFLTKSGDRYSLTQDSALFLSKRSPAYLGMAIDFLYSKTLRHNFADLAGAVRKGRSTEEGEGAIERENPMWVDFARAMGAVMAMPAQMIAEAAGAKSGEKWKVLDIAAGHGLFGLNIAKANPNAEIYAVDWTNVLEVAKENAKKMNLSERFHTLPGSAFEVDFGSGYDLVLLTNILHHFDVATCEQLMRKVHAALKPDGRAITYEFIPNEDRVTPPNAAFFAVVMLVMTPAGDAYTFSEYDGMLRNAGFTSNEVRPLIPDMSSIIVSTK